MPYVDLSDVSLHYQQIVSDDDAAHAEPVTLVHGLASNLAFWFMGAAPLLAVQHDVTLYDLRGHGKSSMPEEGYGPAAMAEDLLHLLDALDIDATHLLAHSYGGEVAIHFTHRYPERVKSLILADVHLSEMKKRQALGSWNMWPLFKEKLASLGIEMDEEDTDFGYRLLEVMARVQVEHPLRAKAVFAGISPFVNRGGRRMAKRWLELLENDRARQEIFAHDGIDKAMLQAIDVPCLAIYGARSQALVSGRVIANNMPYAQFETIPEAGHFFPLSRPKLLAKSCYRFWNTL